MLWKIILSLYLLSLTISARELDPISLNLAENLSCMANQLTSGSGNCGGQISCFGEGEFEAVFERFQEDPYEDCVREICSDYEGDTVANFVESAAEVADMTKGEISEKLDSKMDKLFDSILKNVNDGKEFLNTNPLFKSMLDREQTVSEVLIYHVNAQASQTLEGLDRNLSQLANAFIERTTAKRDELLGRDELERIYHNAESRRLLIGRIEQKVRNLPNYSLMKSNLLRDVYEVQSSLQIGEYPSSTTISKLTALYFESEIEDFAQSDPEINRIKDTIKATAGSEFQQGVTLFEGTENERSMFKEWCSSAISNEAALLPTRADLEVIAQKVEQTKQNIMTTLPSVYSAETARGLGPIIQNTRIVLPASREEYLERMEGFLQEQSGLFEGFETSLKASHAVTLTNMGGMEFGTSFCRNGVETITNAFATTAGHNHNFNDDQRDLVSLGSPFAMSYNPVGERVLGHELGHIASFYVQDYGSRSSSRAMNKAKSCLVGNHNGHGIGAVFSFLEGDLGHQRKKKEEDYADLFSLVTLPSRQNLTCGMFRDGRPLNDPRNTLDTSTQELHSPWFYRLLHEQRFTGKPFPPVCLQQLDAQNESVRFKNCWEMPR